MIQVPAEGVAIIKSLGVPLNGAVLQRLMHEVSNLRVGPGDVKFMYRFNDVRLHVAHPVHEPMETGWVDITLRWFILPYMCVFVYLFI